MLIAEIDLFTYVLPVAVFGAFAAGVWFILDMFSAKKPRAEERLAELRNPGRSKVGQHDEKKPGSVSRALKAASPSLSKALAPKTEREMGALLSRLSHAGFRDDNAYAVFLTLKIIGIAVGAFLGGGVMLFLNGMNMNTLLKSVGIAGVMFFLPDMALWFIAKKRKEAIFLGLPDTLDLLVVCVEAGLGLDQGMRRVAEEMKKSYGVICDEFALCNFHLQMGKPRNEVLQELGLRTGVDDLRALAAILIQADKFGSSVGQALRVQSDSMRTRRRQMAEEKAAKTAVQLIFPLVLFIFPGIFVVLVGPAAITMINEMLPMMNS